MHKPLHILKDRGLDPTGHGYYGAKRGSKLHKGFDLEAVPGESVLSMIDGVITKIGYPYKDNLELKYIEVSNTINKVWLMYANPCFKKGQKVSKGDIIGEVQDVAGYWGNGMINHLHVQIWKNGLLTDAEPYLFPERFIK